MDNETILIYFPVPLSNHTLNDIVLHLDLVSYRSKSEDTLRQGDSEVCVGVLSKGGEDKNPKISSRGAYCCGCHAAGIFQ